MASSGERHSGSQGPARIELVGVARRMSLMVRCAAAAGRVAVLGAFWLSAAGVAVAQTDEIQVYDASIAAPGTINLTWHNNFTPRGQATPAFPGAVVSDKSWNGVPEWAYGFTPWFEGGLYLPLYSLDKYTGWGLDGAKIRLLFVAPDAAARTFFYGLNFEFSYNAKRWDTSRVTSEFRPIIGWHLKPVDIIINPILDTSYDGLANLVFAPASRVAYNLSPKWAIAAEEYAEFGPLSGFKPTNDQYHELYVVIDHPTRIVDIEAGVGFGLTGASDGLTLKLILSRDLYKRGSPRPTARAE